MPFNSAGLCPDFRGCSPTGASVPNKIIKPKRNLFAFVRVTRTICLVYCYARNQQRMKKAFWIFFVLGIFVNSVNAQKYLLMDRHWGKPALLSDSITKADLSIGLLPIYKNDLDTLILLVERFKNLNKSGLNREYFNAEEFKTERFEFPVSNFKRAYGDSYDLAFISYAGGAKTTLKLSDPMKLNPVNQQVVREFLDYLKSTRKKLSKLKTK
jgi:hypothetical protein